MPGSRRLDGFVEIGLFALTVCFLLAHPWNHAYIGERQFGDAAYWDLTAENWARGYVLHKVPDIRPGYSLFLGSLYALFGVDFRWGFAAQAVLLALAAVLAYRLGTALGGRLAGILAGLSLALNSYLNEWASLSVTEMLGSFCNVAALYFLLRALWRPGRVREAVWFGLLLGYGNAVRPLTLFFLAPGALALLLAARGGWGKRARLAGVALGAAALPVALGILYQYLAAGELGLSSNAAANFYGASDPRYRTWWPGVYVEVETDLRRRGIEPTRSRVNEELWRLTAKNYREMPRFQAQRILDGLGNYWRFEGQTERPERYTFFRPYLVALALGSAAVVLRRRGQGGAAWRAALLGAAVLALPGWGLPGLRAAGLAGGLWGMVRVRRPRQVMQGLLAAYWILVGLSQAVVGGTEGFLLHRLYTQVEPVNVLLIALGAVHLVVWRERALVRAARPAPGWWRPAGRGLVWAAGLVMAAGLARMVWANVSAPRVEPYPAPSAAELEALAKRAGWSAPVPWVGDVATIEKMLVKWGEGSLPDRIELYAVPGQVSRFVWHQADQGRTQFWFFFAAGPRPETLDRQGRLWMEAGGRLPAVEWENRNGLVLLAPANAQFTDTGDAAEMNMLTARAFVPWDAAGRRFRMEEPVVFPLQISLVDRKRVAAATVTGTAKAARLKGLRALSLRGQSAIAFRDLEIPRGSKFEAEVVGPPAAKLELWVDGEREADLGKYGGRRVELKLRVVGREEDEVLVGEPRVVQGVTVW